MRSATGELGTDDPNPTVSIHALLAECDPCCLYAGTPHRSFNPRTPCGVRLARLSTSFVFCSFNPRTPCGVRPTPPAKMKRGWKFHSTHSLRSATHPSAPINPNPTVSIHALLAECDCLFHRHHRRGNGFNPRTPCGVRPSPVPLKISSAGFQSTHSLRSATRCT